MTTTMKASITTVMLIEQVEYASLDTNIGTQLPELQSTIIAIIIIAVVTSFSSFQKLCHPIPITIPIINTNNYAHQ